VHFNQLSKGLDNRTNEIKNTGIELQVQFNKEIQTTQKQQEEIQKQIDELKAKVEAKKAEEARIASLPKAPAKAPLPGVAVASGSSSMDFIFYKESGGRTDAVNASSGACGLGQSLPCSKLANVCPNWRTDRDCQVAFFSNYANARYGGWGGAVTFWYLHRWW